jgi:hypothetical protein
MRGRMSGMKETAWVIRMAVILLFTSIAVPAIAMFIIHLRKTGGRFSMRIMLAIVAGVAIYAAVFSLLLRSLPAGK